MDISVEIVAAFTADGQGGNKAGVVLDARGLSAEQMQDIARQIGLSETAFVTRTGDDFQLRFFDPTTEVDLCGHATIAAWSLLRDRGLAVGRYMQTTLADELAVEVTADGVYMQQVDPTYGETVPAAEAAATLNLPVSAIGSSGTKIVSTGLPTLLIELGSEAALERLQPDRAGMQRLAKTYHCTLIHVYTLLDSSETFADTRNFGPALGIFEEAATGTANGALLALLTKRGIARESQTYRFAQGKTLGSLSYVYAKSIAGHIWVGGSAKYLGQQQVHID